MQWTDNTNPLVDLFDTGERCATRVFLGTGSKTEYDLPHGETYGHTILISGSPISSAAFAVAAEGGESGGDRVTFITAPPLLSVISVQYYWKESPRRFYSSSRRSVVVPPGEGDKYYVTNGYESLWQIAGRLDVYGDPDLWFVLAECNPELVSSLFQNMFSTVPAGLSLRIPLLSRVAVALQSVP